MEYSVKEVAEKLGISPHKIRFYTDRELIPGVGRDANGRRRFDDASLGWLRTVIAFRTAGMSIESIRHYQKLYERGEETIDERYRLLVHQQQLTEQKLEELRQQMEVINEKVRSYSKWIQPAGNPPGRRD